MTIISPSTFEHCYYLTGVNIPSTINSIGSLAFNYTNLFNVNIPANTNFIEATAFTQCVYLTGINVHPSNLYYSSISGVLTNKTETILVIFPIGKLGPLVNSYTIPNSITGIGNYAFYDSFYLKNINFNNATTIGNYSFIYSSITGFSNNKVETIGQSAFENTNLTLVESNPNLSSISYNAFAGCTDLKYALLSNSKISILDSTVFSQCTNLKTVLLPNSLKSIGSNSFSNCSSLIEIVIPKDVKTINYSAFQSCTRLARVYFLGDGDMFSISDLPNSYFSIAQIYRLSFRKWPDLYFTQWPLSKLPIILDDFSSAKGEAVYIPNFYNNSIILSSGNGSIKMT